VGSPTARPAVRRQRCRFRRRAHHRVVVTVQATRCSLGAGARRCSRSGQYDITPRIRQARWHFGSGWMHPWKAGGLRPLYVREGSTGSRPSRRTSTARLGVSTGTSLSVTLTGTDPRSAGCTGRRAKSSAWFDFVVSRGRATDQVHLTGSWPRCTTSWSRSRVHRMWRSYRRRPNCAPSSRPTGSTGGALATFVSMAKAVLRSTVSSVPDRLLPAIDIEAKSAGTGVDHYLTVSTPLPQVPAAADGPGRIEFVSVTRLRCGRRRRPGRSGCPDRSTPRLVEAKSKWRHRNLPNSRMVSWSVSPNDRRGRRRQAGCLRTWRISPTSVGPVPS
jgi:hypothetical protein